MRRRCSGHTVLLDAPESRLLVSSEGQGLGSNCTLCRRVDARYPHSLSRLPNLPAINWAVTSLVFLTDKAPSEFAEQLIAAGYHVLEAMDISEVLHLCEQTQVDAVVIAPQCADNVWLPIKLKQPAI